MKKLSYLFGFLTVVTMVISLLPGAALAANPVTIDRDPTLQWATFKVPDRYYSDFVVPSNAPSFEITDMAIGSDGKTFYVVDAADVDDPGDAGGAWMLYKSTNAGIAWSDKIGKYWWRSYVDYWGSDDNYRIWSVEIAPDDPNFVVVVTSQEGDDAMDAPVDIWVSANGGITWANANIQATSLVSGYPVFGDATADGYRIGAVAISPSYGAGRTIAVGLRLPDGENSGFIVTMEAGAVLPGWRDQNFQGQENLPISIGGGDVLVIKFSPNYSGDYAYFIVSTDDDNTGADGLYLHVGFRNVRTNTTMAWDSGIGSHWTGFPREIAVNTGESPGDGEWIETADLELPSDFNGDDARLRKFFVSYDAPYYTATPTNIATADVYRLDNTTIYRLNVPAMIATPYFSDKRIYSIAYYGTSTQGKLLAGAVLGNQCSATVDVWYTLDPLACPTPCWQTSWKPPTGGAGTDCEDEYTFGNAIVAWSPDGKRGYTGTSSHPQDDAVDWPDSFTIGVPLDESAFSITRNDGITWSQISLIDTKIDKYTDVAPAMDCTKVYLASINWGYAREGLQCAEFDSVWMSPNADFAGTQLGSTWERILTRKTSDSCLDDEDGNHAILRLAPDKTDGSVVFWAAGGGAPIAHGEENADGYMTNKALIMWSEDGGDIWYYIRPTGGSIPMTVQDLSAESSSIIYILNREAQVLKMVYARPNWKNADTTIYPSDTCLNVAKSIDSLAEGNVLVGGDSDDGGTPAKVSYSSNGGKTWSQTPVSVPTSGSIHVQFDPAFKDNKMMYAGVAGWSEDDWASTGGLYRWTWGVSTLWDELRPNRAITGIAMSSDGNGIMYASDYKETSAVGGKDSGVQRSQNPRGGTPKPGVRFDRLEVGLPEETHLTVEPNDVVICGCMPNQRDITVWVIDDAFRHDDPAPLSTPHTAYSSVGYIYVFVDCVAKVAPAVTGPDVVGCDPVSGRNQEVNISWEQPCLITGYTITIGKDEALQLELFATPAEDIDPATNSTWYTPPDVTAPKIIIPTDARLSDVFGSISTVNVLECGHKYYYQIRGRLAVTGQQIRTKNSAVKSFTVKAGLRVESPYIGPLLLAPANAQSGVPRQPVSFSWSTFIDSTEYQFQLSKANDPTMAAPLADAKTATTAYEYTQALDYGTNYFWRVRATAPAPSDWSPVFSFLTEKAPPPPAPPPPPPPPPPPTPTYVWLIIAIGALLVIVVLILIVRTRRV